MLKYLKIRYLEEACEKKKNPDAIKKDCYSLQASKLNWLLSMGV